MVYYRLGHFVSIQALLATSAIGSVGGGGATVSLSVVAPLTVYGSSGTFGSCTATVSGGVGSAWVWSVISQVGGTFSISSGAGTATAAAAVTGVSGASATALLQCVVTVSGTPYTVTTALNFTNSTVVSVSQSTVTALSGVTGSTSFNASVIMVTGGTASSYVWSIVSPVNGTFSIGLGAGTDNVNAGVSGVAASTVATATLQCVTVVSGTPYTTSTPLQYTNTSGSSSFTVNVAPLSFSTTGTTATLTTGASAVATVSGGTGPYTYAWLCIDNDGGLPNTNFIGVTATAASTTLRASGMESGGGPVVASFQVTATDILSHTAVGTCSATFERT